jgi:hypothetical protein
MLFSPVYTEAHPRRDADQAASCISSNSFASYSFRTLASHLKATVSSNSLEIKRFRTLCKIPGIGYPFTQSGSCEGPVVTRLSPLAAFHPSPLFSVVSGLLLHNGAPQPLYFQMLPASFHCNGGVYPVRSSSSSTCLFLLFPESTQILEFRPSWGARISFPRFHGSRVTNHESRSLCTLPLNRLTTSNRAGERSVGLPYAPAHRSNRRQSKHVGGLS